MGNISAWRMSGGEWLHPDVIINYGGEYLQLVHAPEAFEIPAWSCCACGKRLQNVSSLSHGRRSELPQFTPHILIKHYPRTRSNRDLERRYCIECCHIPKIEIQEESTKGAKVEAEKTAESATPVLETPETLVLRGMCIVPVFCIRCGERLSTEEKTAKVLLCPHCKAALKPDEGLIDVAFYCTVCGKSKSLEFVEYERKMASGGTAFTLCWPHAFFYLREYHHYGVAKRLALQRALAICMA
jgi:hypothetical protein